MTPYYDVMSLKLDGSLTLFHKKLFDDVGLMISGTLPHHMNHMNIKHMNPELTTVPLPPSPCGALTSLTSLLKPGITYRVWTLGYHAGLMHYPIHYGENLPVSADCFHSHQYSVRKLKHKTKFYYQCVPEFSDRISLN